VNQSDLYLRLADVILIAHFAIVVFIVCGLVAIVIGKWLGWTWIRNRAFRLTHLAAIGIVVLQAWLGQMCPLTNWENALREAAGRPGYSETFVQHWLHRLLFYDAPPWVFAVLYTVFGLLVLAAWLLDRNRGA
jgi:hypothetical protein